VYSSPSVWVAGAAQVSLEGGVREGGRTEPGGEAVVRQLREQLELGKPTPEPTCTCISLVLFP
jgi:hypothetical protein